MSENSENTLVSPGHGRWGRMPLCREEWRLISAQDLQGLLQRLDLVLAALHAFAVAYASVDAARLELVVVLERCIELGLRGLQVLPRRFQITVRLHLQQLLLPMAL